MGLLPPNVKKLKKRRDVKGLVKALSYNVPLVANQAGFALQELKDERAVPLLIRALEDEKSRFRAMWALAAMRDPHAIPILIEMLEDRISRASALRGLGDIGGEAAIEAIKRALEGKDPEANVDALETLGKLGDEWALEHLLSAATAEGNEVSAPTAGGHEASAQSAPAPSGRRCCICGTDLTTRPAMLDNLTGLAYCSDHSDLMSSVDAGGLSTCQSCGFRFSAPHATFGTAAGDNCPSCGKTFGAAASEADEKRVRVTKALEEWMDQALPGDPETIITIFKNMRMGADWGTGTRSEVLDVLDRCVLQDFKDRVEVEFRGVARNGRLEDFQVWQLQGVLQQEVAESLLDLMAGLSFHLIAKIAEDRFAVCIHASGVQDLSGKGKEHVPYEEPPPLTQEEKDEIDRRYGVDVDPFG